MAGMQPDPETERHTENRNWSELMLYSQDSTNVIRNRLITPKQQEQYARVGLQLIPLAQPASVRIAVKWSVR